MNLRDKNILWYKTPTEAIVSTHDFEFLSKDQQSRCKPVYKTPNTMTEEEYKYPDSILEEAEKVTQTYSGTEKDGFYHGYIAHWRTAQSEIKRLTYANEISANMYSDMLNMKSEVHKELETERKRVKLHEQSYASLEKITGDEIKRLTEANQSLLKTIEEARYWIQGEPNEENVADSYARLSDSLNGNYENGPLEKQNEKLITDNANLMKAAEIAEKTIQSLYKSISKI